MIFTTLTFLSAFGVDRGLLTYFADLSGSGWLVHKLIHVMYHEALAGMLTAAFLATLLAMSQCLPSLTCTSLALYVRTIVLQLTHLFLLLL